MHQLPLSFIKAVEDSPLVTDLHYLSNDQSLDEAALVQTGSSEDLGVESIKCSSTTTKTAHQRMTLILTGVVFEGSNLDGLSPLSSVSKIYLGGHLFSQNITDGDTIEFHLLTFDFNGKLPRSTSDLSYYSSLIELNNGGSTT